MTSLTKEPPKTPAQVRKWVSGQSYKCVLSKSPGYKTGHTYKAYANPQGVICLRGVDGFEDICTMLVSGFVKVEDEK